jgi:hypothetical protein
MHGNPCDRYAPVVGAAYEALCRLFGMGGCWLRWGHGAQQASWGGSVWQMAREGSCATVFPKRNSATLSTVGNGMGNSSR